MPYTIVEFQSTPNPNALKCILDRALPPHPDSIRSFRSQEEASGDPLGSALLGLPGISSVLLSGEWLTVNKTPEASWAAVKKEVQRVLAGV